jgi:hypothetical protein
LGEFLEREVARWSEESYEALRTKLMHGPYVSCEPDSEYHLEVQLLEDRDEYVHVSVGICSEKARWSCFFPLSACFLVYRDGRVDKPVISLSAHRPGRDV